MRRIALVLVCLAVAACAGGSGGDDDGGPAQIQLMLFGDAVETRGYNDMIAAFKKQTDAIDVTLTPVADQDELLAKLSTAFAGGSPPDTFLINYRKYGQFAARDALTPVQSYLDDSDAIAEEDFAPTALEAFRFDGQALTCMPQNVSSLVVYYNTELFDEAGLEAPSAGWTWDDFLAAARKLTTGDRYGVGVEPSLIRLAPFVWSAGGEVVDDPLDPTRLTLDQPAAQRAVDFFLDLQSEHRVAPPDREEQSLDAESRFLQGRLGMYLDSRKAVPNLRTITDFTWDVAPLPVARGGEPATILHGDAYCMTAASEYPDETWQFIEFAMSAEGQRILAESGRTVPSRLDVADSDAFLESDKPPASSRVFVENVPHIRAVPHTGSWSRVEGETDTIIEAMFYERMPRDEGLRRLREATAPLFGGG